MVKDHIKRINAPKRWDVLRKNNTFISRPNAGRDFSLCISLNTALKELLGKTKTTKESKYLIKNKGVMINGKIVYDEKCPLGFLDVISFPTSGESHRMLVNEAGVLFLLKIRGEEAQLKLSKVLDKKILSKDTIQLNCSDGRNFLFKASDASLKDIKINDSLLYTLEGQKIKQHIKLEKGAIVYLYKGKHTGNVVTVDAFEGANIIFKVGKEAFETKRAYAFVIGKEKPVISVSEKMIQSAAGASEKPAKDRDAPKRTNEKSEKPNN
jgi:small subunit ribosomal protein S4e